LKNVHDGQIPLKLNLLKSAIFLYNKKSLTCNEIKGCRLLLLLLVVGVQEGEGDGVLLPKGETSHLTPPHQSRHATIPDVMVNMCLFFLL
jgi:hypothetical protein